MTHSDFTRVSKAAVIGAGSMGSGIAAHLANSGIDVVLLDINAEGADRLAYAKGGVERQLQQHGFMDPEFADRITVGTIEQDMALIFDAEWVIEAVIENIEVKRSTYQKIAEHRQESSIVSSNTSTIPLSTLVEGMDENLLPYFAITHFFNPPRHMRLVEVVPSDAMTQETTNKLVSILAHQLGKHAVVCRDTPGFLANRLGNFWSSVAADTALKQGIDIETADAILSRPFGIPRTGVFGLFDYVGIQLMPSVWDSLLKALPEDDAFQRFDITKSSIVQHLLTNGLTGRTGPSGFYRGRKEVIDPEALEYRPLNDLTDPATKEKTARGVLGTDSPAGELAQETFTHFIRYCCESAPELCEGLNSIDEAIELGFAWKQGPFKLADTVGLDFVAELFGESVPAILQRAVDAGGFYPEQGKVLSSSGKVIDLPRLDGVVTAAEITADIKQVLGNSDAAVYKMSDGTGIFTFLSPMNTCTPAALDLIEEVATRAEEFGLKSLVIGNDETRSFSAGADLKALAEYSATKNSAALEADLSRGANAFRKLSESPIPVIAAARGVALGGGCELLLHCDHVVAHAELKVGFPERFVGLYPAWRGTLQTLVRFQAANVENPAQKAFDFIMTGKPLDSIFQAQSQGLISNDNLTVIMNVDEVLAAAVRKAQSLSQSYTGNNFADQSIKLHTADAPSLNAAWQGEDVSPADALIAEALAKVMTAEDNTEITISTQEYGKREARYASQLLLNDANAARAEHMARYRRPLKD